MGQKKLRNLWGQKEIMQPHGTKKNHAAPWDKKKSRNLSRQKKNHINSWDSKKSCNLSGQKNHATSWGEKITHPLGHNHATSRDKKITFSIGTIASKLVHKAPNFSKWHQICQNGSK